MGVAEFAAVKVTPVIMKVTPVTAWHSMIAMVAVLVAAAVAVPVSGGCGEYQARLHGGDAEAACSFAGACVADSCVCEVGWRGRFCEQLDLLPATRDPRSPPWLAPGTLGYNQLSAAGNWTSSWGGAVVRDDRGLYHMWVNELTDSCGMYYWMSNSVVRHATSTDPLTVPFTPREVVWPVWSTEPDVIRAPTGEYVAFFTSKVPSPSTLRRPCTNCSRGNSTFDIATGRGGCGAGCGTTVRHNNYLPFNGSSSDDVEPTVMSWSKSPWGPWSKPVKIPRLMPGFESCPQYGIDENFAAVILSGGRLVALGRGCMTVHVTTASNWKDPSTYVAPTGWRIDDSNGSWWGEDPFIWIDAKGRFHSLTHAGDGSHQSEHLDDPDWGCGRHWFSRNGTAWQHAPLLRYGGCAYSPTTNFTDGSSYRFGRSERPHLVFGADGTTPIALVVAVTAANVSWGSGGVHDASHTFLQPIRTQPHSRTVAAVAAVKKSEAGEGDR